MTDDWQPIATAPRDGSCVRLGHEQDPSSMAVVSIFKTYGEWDGKRWALNAFFQIPGGRYGLLTEQPTHWLPSEGQEPVA